MRKDLETATYVDVTTIAEAVEVVVGAPHEEAVVVGVQNARLEADGSELAHLRGPGDPVVLVVADGGLTGPGTPGHLGDSRFREGFTGLDGDKIS